MKAKHTPGPWIVSPRDDTLIKTPSGQLLGHVLERRSNPDDDTPHEEAVANARLIAASPDLLAACVLAAETIAQLTVPGGSPKFLLDAIAKATN